MYLLLRPKFEKKTESFRTGPINCSTKGSVFIENSLLTSYELYVVGKIFNHKTNIVCMNIITGYRIGVYKYRVCFRSDRKPIF